MKNPIMQWWQRFFAALYPTVIRRYERAITPRKKDLFANVSGNVLELGPGPGSNLRYCERATSWTGVEPNQFMHRWIARELDQYSINWKILDDSAELISQKDETFDAVITTLVLCSVDRPDKVLEQIRRLLKPGGKFYFIEHVAEPERRLTRTFQRLIRPFWRICANGCRTDLNTLEIIASAGFSSVSSESFHVSKTVLPWFLSPHIAGCATR